MDLSLTPLAPDLTPVLETALDAVVIMRADGTVAGWNAVAETVFGRSRDEAIGAQLSELIIPHRFREAHHRGLERFLETGEGAVLNRHIEVSALRANGEEFPVELSITPAGTSDNLLFLGFLRDITDRKLAEQTIRRRAAEAEAVADLTSFAAEDKSFGAVMQRCLEAVCRMTGWKLGHAFSCPQHAGEPLVDTGIWHAADERDFLPLSDATRQIAFRPGVGLPGRTLEKLSPVWLSQVEADENFPRASAAALMGLRAAFAFPILSVSRPIAVLEFFNDEPAAPDPALLQTLQTLSEQVGRVFERIRNAELLGREREALLGEIERRKQLERQQQLLVNELNHRVKNMLAVVAGIAHQTGKGAVTVPEFIDAFQGRLSALATAHSLLTREGWRPAPLTDLVAQLIEPFAAEDGRVRADGPDVVLAPQPVVALSLILHELLTNALKHGALGTADGTIEISWTVGEEADPPVLQLCWRERGVSGVKVPERAGFGSKLLETSVTRELGGTLTKDWRSDGLAVEMVIPLGTKKDDA